MVGVEYLLQVKPAGFVLGLDVECGKKNEGGVRVLFQWLEESGYSKCRWSGAGVGGLGGDLGESPVTLRLAGEDQTGSMKTIQGSSMTRDQPKNLEK